MRFIVDEYTGPKVAAWLEQEGHDVYSVYDQNPGIDDSQVLDLAVVEDRVLVTCDKDFGDLIFREGRAHCGVVLLRHADLSPAKLITSLDGLLQQSAVRLENSFIVLSEAGMRVH